jgi:L-asparaginase II
MKTLAAVTRNRYVESIHQGYIHVTDSEGRVLYQAGETKTSIFFRSAAKPFQVMPFIQSGGARAMNFSLKEIAAACASHTGETMHQETVSGILDRLDLKETDLHCGTMRPLNAEEKKRLLMKGEEPSPLHTSCSGKHAAMLAYAKYSGFDIKSYEDLSHPIQQEILKTIAEFTDQDTGSMPTGTDGCGLPIYMLPIEKIALAYARLTAYANDAKSLWHTTCRTIFDAMTQYPEMIEGTGEFDTELMQATKGKLICKVGAEAVYCIGIRKGNIGICIKIADGNERAVYPVAIQLLLELNFIEKSEYEALKHWHTPELMNNLKEHIGNIYPVFQMKEPVNLGDRLV